MSRPFSGPCPENSTLLLRALGFLEEPDEGQLDEHVRSCGRCGPLLRAIQEGRASEFAATGDHVPPGILARWPGVRSALPAPALAAVERHFDQCAACSDDLAKLVRIREALEEEEETGELVGAGAERTFGGPSFDAPSERPVYLARALMLGRSEAEVGPEIAPQAVRRPRRGILLLGGYAALATAAAVILALRGPLTEGRAPTPVGGPKPGMIVTPSDSLPVPGEQSPGSPGGIPKLSGPLTGETTPSPTPSWQVRVLQGEPRSLPSVLRGEESAPPILERERDPGALVVRVDPPLSITDDSAMTLELLGTDRTVLARTRARGADFHGGGTILLTMGGTGLPAGRYVIRLRTQGGAEAGGEEDIVEYPFRLGALR